MTGGAVAPPVIYLFQKFIDGVAEIVDGVFVAGGDGIHHTVAHMVLENDLAGVGAAVMAGVGSGVFTTMEEGYRALAVKNREVKPDPRQAAVYAALRKVYSRNGQHLASMYQL